MKSKICFKCNTEQPLSEYYKHPRMSDGHLGKCKDCTKKDASVRTVMRTCVTCNKEFMTWPQEIKRGGGLNCSRNCYHKHLSKLLDDKYSGKRSYAGIHKWVRRELGQPSLCAFCNTTDGKFEWSNISGKYLEDLSDWQRLCIKCHRNYDDVGNKAWAKRGKKFITAWGETRSIQQWSLRTGITVRLINQRLVRDKMSPEKALTK